MPRSCTAAASAALLLAAGAGAWATLAGLGVTARAAESTPVGRLPGGLTTRRAAGPDAFSLPAANLPRRHVARFFAGQRLFNIGWVKAPSPIGELDGLGPVFNRISCGRCHVRDGRGRPPVEPGAPMLSMLVRLSVPGRGPRGGPKPHPAYGDQINDRAIPGVAPEGRARLNWRTVGGAYGDGTPYTLRAPVIGFTGLAYGPMGETGRDVLVSPRVAPAVFGLGLLEAVPEQRILARADPGDRDRDGISGRPNLVWDVARGASVLGRFGWKANQPTLRQQAASAFVGDIGITTSLYPRQNCTAAQKACRSAPSGGAPELDDARLAALTFYLRTLAVPARRNADRPGVRKGEVLFVKAGCAACHTPTLRTGGHPTIPALSNQLIHPYTDLLLHDMGPGLADGRADFTASGREWRTPPLWGIGLVGTVNGHTDFLHDGRARGLAEAILWHGGEAAAAREAFRAMNKANRDALIAFLRSL